MPVVALLWSVISFTVAVGAFCIQSSTDLPEKILLSVIIGILGVCGSGVVIFFWRIWRPQRDYEIQPSPSEVMSLGSAEFIEPYEPQGWKGRASAKAREHWA